MTRRRPTLTTLALIVAGFGTAPRASAENLLDIYRLAQERDPAIAQALAAHRASSEKRTQGTAQLLPTVVINASHYEVNQDIRQPPPARANDYGSDAYSLQLTQPLYRKSNFAVYAQGKEVAAQADAQLAVAQGELMLRATRAYFEVLAAQDGLEFARTEKAAIDGQRRLAERNFSVGNATVVDVHEARARHDLAFAQELGAENELLVKREALAALVNVHPELARLAPDLPLEPPAPAALDHWLKTAHDRNPLIKAQERAIRVAEEEIEKERGVHYPTLDLVASHAYNKSNNVFSTSTFEYTTNQVGVQLLVPLYAGGVTHSRVREAEARRDQARAVLDEIRRTTTRLTREGHLAVINGVARVRALEQAQASSKRALESTLIGYESGVRTGVDVLNAQRDLYRTQRDLSQARYAYLLSHVQLKLAAGTLNEDDLAQVNTRLIDAPLRAKR